MADPLMIQKQIKDNNEDLVNFVRDLKLWEEEMKRKDHQLSNDKSEEVLPPIRRAKVSKKQVEKKETEIEQSKSVNKRIRSYDYKAWDNFDVEKACEEVDKDGASEKDCDTDDDTDESREKYMKEKALYEKDLGNKHVKASRWDEAIEAYTRAITAFPKDPVFFANRALCYLKKDKYEAVEADCTESLKLDSTYVKALLRRAAARERLARVEDARADLRLALQLEPNNPQALRDLNRLKATAPGNVVTKSNDIKAVIHEKVKKESNDYDNSELKKKTKGSLSLNTSSIVKKTIVNEVEPNWEPCSSTIEPISKPPHLRSKKSLKRVEIFDVGRNAPKHTCHRLAESSSNDEVATSPMDNTVRPHTVHTVSSPVFCVPPAPINSVQFYIAWKAIRSNKKMCHQFLKQISGESLPDIFKESLESSVFGDIIEILCTEFVPSDDPVLAYLIGLSRVRRFTAITLFMSTADKSNVQKLLDYSLKKGECSREEINNLRRTYELK